MMFIYPAKWQQARIIEVDPKDCCKVISDEHVFFYINLSTGVLLQKEDGPLVFIPGQNVSCHVPEDDEDPPVKQWGFLEIPSWTYQQNPPGVTVSPGEWYSSGGTYEVAKPEGDF